MNFEKDKNKQHLQKPDFQRELFYQYSDEKFDFKQFLNQNKVNIILLIATIISTLLVGSMLEGGNPFENLIDLFKGIPFSLTLMVILGSHELGHYFATRKYKIKATLPYFIPAPTIFGTFGAFIKIKSPIYNRKALFDIGAAGPLTGFFFTVIAIFYGLNLSEVREISQSGGIFFGSSLLFEFAARIVIGPIPEGFDIFLSPVAYAGWIGMIVTALNLMPMGQLDGGHIIYAVFGEKHKYIAKATFITLIFMSFIWFGWIIWAFIGLIMKIRHPKTLSDAEPLDRKRKKLGYLCLFIFIISFIPVPIKMM